MQHVKMLDKTYRFKTSFIGNNAEASWNNHNNWYSTCPHIRQQSSWWRTLHWLFPCV